jgi:hypothetical protein
MERITAMSQDKLKKDLEYLANVPVRSFKQGKKLVGEEITITSDGTAAGTKVQDSNGIELSGAIQSIQWSVDARDGVATVQIKLVKASLKASGELTQAD